MLKTCDDEVWKEMFALTSFSDNRQDISTGHSAVLITKKWLVNRAFPLCSVLLNTITK